MKYNFSIIGKLRTICFIWFVLTIISLIIVLSSLFFPNTDFFIKNGSIRFGAKNSFKNGFEIPAKITINMPADTIVKYQNGNASGSLNLNEGDDNFRFHLTDSILNNESFKKEFYFSKWIIMPSIINHKNESISGKDQFDLFNKEIAIYTKEIEVNVEKVYFFDTTIKMRTKSIFKNILLSLSMFISILLSLLVSFQFVKIFDQLYKRISFLQNFYKRLYSIGLAIIISTLIKLLLSFIYSTWYGGVRLINASDNVSLSSGEYKVQFNPTFDFNFNYFLLGLCIIVLSYIFKYGNAIEQENVLTV
jgi:Protein of unknown function (DUF2975)